MTLEEFDVLRNLLVKLEDSVDKYLKEYERYDNEYRRDYESIGFEIAGKEIHFYIRIYLYGDVETLYIRDNECLTMSDEEIKNFVDEKIKERIRLEKERKERIKRQEYIKKEEKIKSLKAEVKKLTSELKKYK